jgi:hypothetical protein
MLLHGAFWEVMEHHGKGAADDEITYHRVYVHDIIGSWLPKEACANEQGW